jgi:hypothetical protein
MPMNNFSLLIKVHPQNGSKDITVPSSRTTYAWEFPLDSKKWQYLHYLLWKATQPLVDLGIGYDVVCTETRDGIITNVAFPDRKRLFKTYDSMVVGAEERLKEREQAKLERKVKTKIKSGISLNDFSSASRDELIKELIKRYSDPSFEISEESLKKAAEHLIDSGFLGKRTDPVENFKHPDSNPLRGAEAETVQ